jgi:hypothetical protein
LERAEDVAAKKAKVGSAGFRVGGNVQPTDRSFVRSTTKRKTTRRRRRRRPEVRFGDSAIGFWSLAFL